MSLIHAECERVVAAPAETVYAFLADYRDHHPHILPTDTFFDVTVLEGDVGAGVLIAYRFLAGGRERSYQLRVSEPRPGMTLVERDELSTMVMTYMVTPEDGGAICRVKITGEWQSASGVEGIMERAFAPAALRAIFERELALLDAEVKSA
jgi:polyketide cyclase/dehydrase/lipid transport protein